MQSWELDACVPRGQSPHEVFLPPPQSARGFEAISIDRVPGQVARGGALGDTHTQPQLSALE